MLILTTMRFFAEAAASTYERDRRACSATVFSSTELYGPFLLRFHIVSKIHRLSLAFEQTHSFKTSRESMSIADKSLDLIQSWGEAFLPRRVSVFCSPPLVPTYSVLFSARELAPPSRGVPHCSRYAQCSASFCLFFSVLVRFRA